VKTIVTLLIALIFPLLASAGEYGYLKVTVLEINAAHNTPVSLKIKAIRL
jgi:hypothetical protein